MNNNHIQTIQIAFDEAIAKVAEDQWSILTDSLKEPCARTRAAEAVYESLCSLDQLSKDMIPRYNNWDALFYLTWYQPRQINLVYSLLSKVGTSKSSDETISLKLDLFVSGYGSVRIIDFGCGCLATMFAVALAATDTNELGEEVPEIVIDCIDTSQEMMDIGIKTWTLFRDTIRRIDRHHPVCNIFDKISPKMVPYSYNSTPCPSANEVPCLISAIHCVYNQTICETKSALISHINHLNPVAVLLTTHSSKVSLLDIVFPHGSFQNYYSRGASGNEINLRFKSSYLDKTSKWRGIINSRLGEDLYRVSRFELYGNSYLRGLDPTRYLTNNVNWWKNDFCYKVLLKKDIYKKRGVKDDSEFDDDLPF